VQTDPNTEQKRTKSEKTENTAAKPSPRDSATEKKSGGFFLTPGISMETVMSYSLMAGYAGTWGGYAKKELFDNEITVR
jgi:hypothetical protein